MTTKLPHDKSGFLIGERLVSGMDAAARDLNDIRDLLQLTASKRGQAETKAQATLEAIERNTRRTRDIGVSGGVAAAGISRRASEVGETAGSRGRSAPAQVRERDERGRFLPTGGAESGKTEKAELKRAGILSSLVSAVRGRMGGVPDTENLDPTLSAIHEARQLVGPFARVGGMMFKAGGWLMGRGKKGEELPKEQRRHNRLIEKLLKRIAGEGGHGAGGSLFGGLFSSLSSLLKPFSFVMRVGGAGMALLAAWEGGQAVGKWIYDKFEPQISAVADAIGSSVKTAIAAYDKAVTAVSDSIEWIAEKLGVVKDAPKNAYDAAVDKVSAGMQKLGDAMGFNPAGTGRGPAPKTFTDDKAAAIAATAQRLGIDPNDLATAISFETGGTFDPASKNPFSSATGLIQFTEATAKWLGTSTKALKGMSFDDQMVYVEKYLKAMGVGKGGKTGLADIYNAIQGIPASGYLKGSTEYEMNKSWDANGDGRIMPDEAVTSRRFQGHNRIYYPAKRAASIPMPGSANPPGTGVLKIPPAPKVQQQVGGNKGWTVVNAGVGGDISQNVADRALAHALTGGLGMDNARWP